MTNARVTDASLRELHEQMLDARGNRSRERCATPEALRAVVQREGPEEERLTTLDHVMSCGECLRELELLRALHRADAQSGGVATLRPTGQPRVPWRHFMSLALAASVILAVGIGLMSQRSGPGAGDIWRGGGTAVTLLTPTAGLAGSERVIFSWRPVAGATRYDLEVLDAAGGVAFSAATTDTTVTLPDPPPLVPGAEYRWWVRAVDAAGAQRASAMRPLRVRRE